MAGPSKIPPRSGGVLVQVTGQGQQIKLRECTVKLRRLQGSEKPEKQNRFKYLTNCRVDLNNSVYKSYIRQYQEKQILVQLEKLEKESTMRELLLSQREGKVNKTRTSLACGTRRVHKAPETPQAQFLENFYLKPSEKTSAPNSMKMTEDCPEKVFPMELSKDSDVDSGVEDNVSVTSKTQSDHGPAPQLTEITKSLERTPEKEDVNMKGCSIDLIRMMLSGAGSPVLVNDLHECSLCPRTFVKEGHLKKHFQRIHSASSKKESLLASNYTCQTCDILFYTKVSLRRHEVLHHQLKSKEAPRLWRAGRECGECSSQFSSAASLKRHILTEHRGFKSACPRCGQNVARLDNHMASVHGLGLSPCPQCGALILPAHLTRHIKTVHLGYRQRCFLCDKFFSNLHKHVRNLHGGDHTDHSNCDCPIFQGPHCGRAT